MRHLLIIFLIIGSQTYLSCQQKYWVFFTDKGSQLSGRDTPVLSTYVDSLKSLSFHVVSSSKWLNAIVIDDHVLIDSLKNISFVKHTQPVGKAQQISQTSEEPSVSSLEFYLNQMSGWSLVNKGLTGKDIKIGLIDAGYADLNNQRELNHLFKNNQLIAFRDFINPERKTLDEEISGSTHGQKVLSKITGYKEEEQNLIGFATGAYFYLARTENSEKEHRVEEYDWIQALEWMDSLGVQLVNSSLGYSEFDDSSENYTKAQLTGKIAVTSVAAEIAVKEKGMFIVISAGNAGNSSWGLLTVPADAPSVLTVGATVKEGGIKISYSSIGPDYNEFLKPDVAVYSPNGTSFSAPAVTGFVACLMEYAPKLSNIQLLKIVRESASLYPYGNNYIGYGVPNAQRAMSFIDEGVFSKEFVYEKEANGKKVKITFKNQPLHDIAIFQKSDKWTVGDQFLLNLYSDFEVMKSRNIRVKNKKTAMTIVLNKKSWEKFTTIQNGKEVIEIIWK